MPTPIRPRWLVGVSVAVLLAGCGEKPKPADPQGNTPAPTPGPAPAPAADATPKPLSPLWNNVDYVPPELLKIGQKHGARVGRGIFFLPPETYISPARFDFGDKGPTDEQLAALAQDLTPTSGRFHIIIGDSSPATPEGIAKLKLVPGVVGLRLGKSSRVLKSLEGMTQLEILYISGPELTDADLAPVATFSGLRVLYVFGEKFTPAVLAHLAGLKELRKFEFLGPEWTFTDAALGHLKGLTKLEQLEIVKADFTDAGFAQLKGLTALREFDWRSTGKCTAAALDVVAGWPALEKLRLPGFKGAEYARLAPLKKLKEVQFTLDPEAFASLTRVTSLEKLNFFPEYITDADLVHIGKMSNLRHLELNSVAGTGRLTDAGVAHLKGLTHLKLLYLGGHKKLTDASVEHLKNLTELEKLDLEATGVTDAGLNYLKGMAKLESLTLNETAITDKAVDTLRQLPKLYRLNVGKTKMTKATAEALAKEKKLAVSTD